MAYDSYPLIVSRALAATPTVFTNIADLDVVALPEMGINEADASVQNSTIDKYVFSTLLRRKPVPLTMNFLPFDGSQDNITGLYKAMTGGTIDGYKFSHSASGLLWVGSGAVTNLKPVTPMEGKLQLAVTLRLTGLMSIQGLTVGT
jgi:hypothetical protein